MVAVQDLQPGTTPRGIAWGLVAGFLAFGADLSASYVLNQHPCVSAHSTGLRNISILCFLLAISGFWTGWREYQRLPEEALLDGRRLVDRTNFQAVLSMSFSLAFAIGIIALAVPRWILGPCN